MKLIKSDSKDRMLLYLYMIYIFKILFLWTFCSSKNPGKKFIVSTKILSGINGIKLNNLIMVFNLIIRTIINIIMISGGFGDTED